MAIVTLGQAPWVLLSARRWLPTLDVAELLEELGIEVIYARACLERRHIAMSKRAEGVNLYTLAKRRGMERVLRRHRRLGGFAGNVLCVGDAEHEHDAIKELVWGLAEEPHRKDLACKNVRFMPQPSLKVLGSQLLCLSERLGSLVARADDFDVCMDGTWQLVF